jgi:2-polyprenyl-6-hydroxyphenyl methylase/3-demethylubiquinone-9 3-methyltransferase
VELRFEFGKNWKNYSRVIDEEKISRAIQSLQEFLGAEDLKGKSFLDIGSGSGLFSLAAARLGARVHSFDYDKNAVECTAKTKERFMSHNNQWVVEQGSVLDDAYMGSLGSFDVVYSWGVLHHTGDMWKALKNAGLSVKNAGQLFIAIYNDQGGTSRRWTFVKRFYNKLPIFLKLPYILFMGVFFMAYFSFVRVLNLKNPFSLADWGKEQKYRGMTAWYDLVDWVGGFPFEVARPDDIFNFYSKLGYTMQKLRTVGTGHGCNEYVFKKGN